ncbi:hypothetical protein IWW37_000927 [Coemansia sp. RSA 2050]|nr:hypothetical protein IWW37_000927 [Coemansia sp. RSA 2050]KAJ2733394.1 hypothetical protein IW152_003132 [Coemansia sp. BCRC 34962]
MSTTRVYELEAAAAELRDANSRSQATIERLERDRQHTLEELETLHASHSRLEARFFETESGLTAATAKLDRALRTNSTLEAAIDQKSAALDREREAWNKKEVELNTELAAAKRKAMVQRRQTVSIPSSHSRSGSTAGSGGLSHSRTPSYAMPSSSLSPPVNARALQRSSPDDYAGSDPASDDVLSRECAERQLQTQIHQLTRRLREAEARAQQAADQAGRMHMDSEQAAADLDACQRKAERLEHTVKQLSELNESLREDNESYQVLLQMSTMKGGFSFNNPRSSLESRASSGKWASGPSGLADDGTPDGAFSGLDDLANMPGSPGSSGLDLASELGQALDLTSGATQTRVLELEEQVTQLKEELRKTKYERRHLDDENKALSLYVNKILGRILASSDGLEAVLSRDYESAGAKKRDPIPAPAPFAVPVRPSVARPVSPLPKPLSFAARGSGDGITSVFIPPTSPTLQRAAPPIIQPAQEPTPQSPPPYTRRARSATVAAGQALAEAQASCDVSASSATISGAWWKRMSVRLGSSWHASEEAPAE